MQLHNTTQYAIRILSYIASQDNESPSNATVLAATLDLPYKFLTKIMRELVVAGLVKSTRGRDGGYVLNKKASDIKLVEILEIFNDMLNDEYCVLGIGVCDSNNKCALHDQWSQPKTLLQDMFKNTSLQDLIGRGSKF